MSLTTYLLRANTESDFEAMVKYLKSKGHKWADDEENTTYSHFRNELGSRKVILLRGMYNGMTKQDEIKVTYLSQFNRLMTVLGLPNWNMRNVQTVIPMEFYKGVKI